MQLDLQQVIDVENVLNVY